MFCHYLSPLSGHEPIHEFDSSVTQTDVIIDLDISLNNPFHYTAEHFMHQVKVCRIIDKR